jgi:hypothetical protein
MSCPFTLDLGVYSIDVLGAADRDALERHLPTCARCRAELAELQRLPGLLATVRAAGLDLTAERPGPPAGLLDRTLRAASAERRTRRARRLVLAAAAALALVAGGIAVGGLPFGETPQPPPASSSAGPAAASTTILTLPAGARIDMTLTGLPPDTSCRLVVHARDGHDQTVSSWHVTYAGAMRVSATTTVATGDIERLDVVDDDSGHLLVAVNADSVPKKSR